MPWATPPRPRPLPPRPRPVPEPSDAAFSLPLAETRFCAGTLSPTALSFPMALTFSLGTTVRPDRERPGIGGVEPDSGVDSDASPATFANVDIMLVVAMVAAAVGAAFQTGAAT